MKSNATLHSQADDYNTSDEEFERQLAEVSTAADSPSDTSSVKGKAKTKMGRGQGRPPKKKASHHLKKTQRFPTDGEGDGYEVGAGSSQLSGNLQIWRDKRRFLLTFVSLCTPSHFKSVAKLSGEFCK